MAAFALALLDIRSRKMNQKDMGDVWGNKLMQVAMIRWIRRLGLRRSRSVEREDEGSRVPD